MQILGVLNELSQAGKVALTEPKFIFKGVPYIESID